MATFIKYNPKGYNTGSGSDVASNSLVVENGDALKISGGLISKAGAGETIVGVSTTNKTFASNNATVAKEVVIYSPVSSEETYKIGIASGTSLVFNGSLVASNTINLKVNGVAMTQVTFATSAANTMGLIATQLKTQFPNLITDAYVHATLSNVVAITVKGDGVVAITDVVVAGGTSQISITQSDSVVYTDDGTFYDITSTQLVDGMTQNNTSGQLRLVRPINQASGIFAIANT